MKVCILGDDKRSLFLRKLYKDQVPLKDADIVFCPIPFSKNGIDINCDSLKIDELIYEIKDRNKILVTGVIKNDIRKKLDENNIKFYDLMEYEEFSILNAEATVEGAIKKAIDMTDFTLNNSNILVLGYGRIGKILAHILDGFGANIYCEARSRKDIALIKSMGYNEVDLKHLDCILPDMDIIFNTIPSMILDKASIDLLKDGVCIIDLASAPGGVNFEYCLEKGINTSWYLAIPSKDSPYSAALYIKETVDNILGEEDYGREN